MGSRPRPPEHGERLREFSVGHQRETFFFMAVRVVAEVEFIKEDMLLAPLDDVGLTRCVQALSVLPAGRNGIPGWAGKGSGV